MTKLSEHFTLEELTYSDTANAYKVSNMPTEIHKKTLKHTCDYFLEPLRALLNKHYGKAFIKITSGYRSKNVNNLLKKQGYNPSETSQHCLGEGVDMQIYKVINGKNVAVPYTEVYNLIKTWVKSGKISVDQCIQEKQGSMVWVHCSYKAGGASVNRKQFLKYNGKTYTIDNN